MGQIVAVGGNGHTTGDGQAVTKRAGGDFDAGNAGFGDVAGDVGSVLIKLVEPFEGKEAAEGQGDVKARGGVSFGHDEAVAGGPVGLGGIEAKNFAVKDGEKFGGGEDRAHGRGL